MYSFQSRIRYSETDVTGNLSLPGIVDYFQDCSTFQSEQLGVGISFLRDRHLLWVVSAWQIEVNRYPALGETVSTGTFPYAFKGFMGYRNFLMTGEGGEVLARAASLWSLISTETGKPVRAPLDVVNAYTLEEKLPMDYAPRHVLLPDGKKIADEGRAEKSFAVTKQNLDRNGHVNNGRFIELAMSCLPDEPERKVKRLRAEYCRQAFEGDQLFPYVVCAQEGTFICLGNEQGEPYVNVELTVQASIYEG